MKIDTLRPVYLVLATEGQCTLCSFCKFAAWVKETCGAGYAECEHPVSDIKCGCEPDLKEDCDLFKPIIPLDTAADLVGAMISSGSDWFSWVVNKNKTCSFYIPKESANNVATE